MLSVAWCVLLLGPCELRDCCKLSRLYDNFFWVVKSGIRSENKYYFSMLESCLVMKQKIEQELGCRQRFSFP